jgi:hypothetical protein
MKPKGVNEKDWKKLQKKYSLLNFENWSYLDGNKKINLLKGAGINIVPIYLFRKDYNLKYPEDIYMFKKTEKLILDPTTLNSLRHMILDEIKEIGGTINFIERKFKMEILFIGNENNIDLNLEKDTQTLFHTHPIDEELEFDPPSVLDIISFLILNVESISKLIIDLGNGIEHPIDDALIVQNSMVFTKNEVYVYYISYPLLKNIIKYIIDLYKNSKDFIYSVEKLLEMIEIHYSIILSSFNRNLNNYEIKEYINFLSSLGIIMKRFDYLSVPESYILI